MDITTMHWRQIAANPNAREVLSFRSTLLNRVRCRPVADRIDYLSGVARGKRVLDVGVVNHLSETSQDTNWLHGRLAAVAAYCIGVDILEAEIRKLQEQGYNVTRCDITSSPEAITEKFDIMVCGELIEHLGNPGGLFAAAGLLLEPGGKLLLSTPNPYYLGRVLRHLFNAQRESADHVALLFPSGIAELAERAGLELTEYHGVYLQPLTLKRRLFLPFKWLVGLIMNDEAVCDTLIYVCSKPATG